MSKRSTQLSHGVLKASSGTATQLLFCESNLLCHYIVCRYAAVLFYLVGLGRSWKAHKLESNWFPAEALLLPGPLCSPGESLWDFVKEEKENAVVSRLGKIQYRSKWRVTSFSVSYLFLLPGSHGLYAHLILCPHQLPTTPATMFLSI